MRFAPVLAVATGIAAMVALVYRLGAAAVLHSLVAIGAFGFASVCLIRTLRADRRVMGLAWGALLPEARPWVAVWGRFVRDAGSEVLPLSQVGGYVLGTRAVAIFGVPATRGVASTIVDVTLVFVGQLAYIALGLIWLLHLNAAGVDPLTVLLGLAGASILAVAFIVMQRRRRAVRAPDRACWAAAGPSGTAAGAKALYQSLDAIYRRRRGIRVSPAAAFRLLDRQRQRGLGSALFCRRAAALRQHRDHREPGLRDPHDRVFCPQLGRRAGRGLHPCLAAPSALATPEMALALSLLKRARDLAIGLPVLALWQAVEGGRLARRLAAKAPAAPLPGSE